MKIELNPWKWGARPDSAVAVPTGGNVLHQEKAAKAEEMNMAAANKFVGVLEAIGKGFLKGLNFAIKYAIPAEKLTAVLFPQTAAVMPEVIDATGLVQNAVMLVEQKYAASNQQTGSGAAKMADVLVLVGPTVQTLLQKAGVQADPAYVKNLVSAVVGILNLQLAPTEATAA